MSIKKRGNKFIVTSKGGRLLGSHSTRAAAARQLRAVEASKHDSAHGSSHKRKK